MTLTETPPAEEDSPESAVQDQAGQELTGELAGRLFEAGLGAFELATVSLGTGSASTGHWRTADPAPQPSSRLPPGQTPGTPVNGANNKPLPGS